MLNSDEIICEQLQVEDFFYNFENDFTVLFYALQYMESENISDVTPVSCFCETLYNKWKSFATV